jgi:hypothetical protein
MDERANDLLGVILDGAEAWDLITYVREREGEEDSPWKLADGEKPMSYSQIMRYRAMAERLIADSSRVSRKRLMRKHQAQRRKLYATAVQQGDVRAAAAVLKDLAELQGLYPPKKVAPTNPAGDKPYDAQLSDADRAAALEALYARLGAPGGTAPAAGPAGADRPLLDRPGAGHERRGDEPGPLASLPAAGGPGPDPPPLFPASR